MTNPTELQTLIDYTISTLELIKTTGAISAEQRETRMDRLEDVQYTIDKINSIVQLREQTGSYS